MVRTTEFLTTEAEVKSRKDGADGGGSSEQQRPEGEGRDDLEARSVLVLTPDAEIAETLCDALRCEGHHAEVVTDAGDAAMRIRQRRAKGIVGDVLPEWGESIVLRRVLARTAALERMPFIALTSIPEFRDAFDDEPGPHEWAVAKPVSLISFRAAIRAAFPGASEPRAEPAGDARNVRDVAARERSMSVDVPSPPGPRAVQEMPEMPSPAGSEDGQDVPSSAAPSEGSDETAATSTKDRQGDERVYERALEAVGALFDSPDSLDTGLMREAQRSAEAIVADLALSDDVLVHVLDRGQAFSLTNHSVNVCALCAKIGEGLGYSPSDRHKLAFVGLVHDLGMCRMPRELLLKEGTLDQEEAELIKTHPDHTKEIVLSFGEEFRWAADIVYQEHERENGTGYPQGLAGSAIHDSAKAIAVADIFEAFSHPRSFRKTFVSNEALHKVIEMRGRFCSARIIKALMDQITMFPLGTFVELNTGEVGTVVGVSRRNVLSPAVRIEYGVGGVRLSQPRVVNLENTPTTFVLRPLAVEDLPGDPARQD